MTADEIHAANAALVRDYRLTFGTPHGQRVLFDLMGFCRFRAPLQEPLQIDEGKRRVFLRIENFMNFTAEQLQLLYGGRPFVTPLEGDKADG